MKKILAGALAALSIGGALAATTVPASAAPYGWHGGGGGGRGWHGGGYGWRGGYGYGGAAAAGLFGLAAGAAIAGSYGPHYYAPGYYYGAPAPCRVEMRWNPNWGGYDRVRVCY